MIEVDQAIELVTYQVHDQIRWIELHNATLSGDFAFADATDAMNHLLDHHAAARAQRQKAIDAASAQAKEEVLQPLILKYVCPALQSVAGDVFEISKILVGVLVPLSIARTITISWNPLVIAAGAFLIARASISSICKDVDTHKSKK